MTPVEQEYREIPLSQGLFAKVSPEDYEKVSHVKWWAHINSRGYRYARGNILVNGKLVATLMHKFILPGFSVVDHHNGNGLDCTRGNLRGCPTGGHNVANQKARAISGYKGVYSRGKKFVAMISDGGKRSLYLGIYSTAEQAARVYDTAAIARWGEFAKVNFP